MSIVGLHFPPGGRLGIDLCDSLNFDFSRDPRQLSSDDLTLCASIEEVPWFEPVDGHDQWQRDRAVWRLDDESPAGGALTRRIWTRIKPAPYAPLTSAAIACPEALHILDLSLDNKAASRRRWAGLMARVAASAAVRPAIDIAQWLREHALSLDAHGLHATHFGSRLHLTLAKPATPAAAWFGSRIVIATQFADPNGPPWPRAPFDHETEWHGPSLTWLLQREAQPLEDGTVLWTHAAGQGARLVLVSAISEAQDRSIMEARMMSVLGSMAFTNG